MAMRRFRRWRAATVGGLALGLVALAPGVASAGPTFFGTHNTITSLGTTVPGNGDVNPYGVAVVPASVGKLEAGDILVSNFNDKGNQQGTGRTIVEVPPGGDGNGPATVFATVHLDDDQRCPGGVGLTTALAVFPSGWVVVGSLPTTDGTSATERAGCLIVLNAMGHVVETISGGAIDGPWDMTAAQLGDHAVLFVSNVLNGLAPSAPPSTVVNEGTVVRLVLDLSQRVPKVESEAVIADGFPEHNDPNALVVGPTGLGLSHDAGVLYVADTAGNRVTRVPAPLALPGPVFGAGMTVSAGGAINGPLGLTVAPNGDILTANGGDGNGVEITPGGAQVATMTLDTSGTGAGSLFGVALAPQGNGLYFVNDGNNSLNILK